MKRRGDAGGKPDQSVTSGADQVIAAAEFKARCLAILDQVAITGEPVTVTKRGKPVARVVPVPEVSRSIFGSVRLLSPNPEDYYGTGEVWNAERGEL